MISRAVVFDLDGTLADHKHRVPLVEGRIKNWLAYYALCYSDKPNRTLIELCRHLSNNYKILIFSGRSEMAREMTVQWLFKYKVPFDLLQMRGQGNGTPNDILKYEWFEEYRNTYNIKMAFDDNINTVAMWRVKAGIQCYEVKI